MEGAVSAFRQFVATVGAHAGSSATVGESRTRASRTTELPLDSNTLARLSGLPCPGATRREVDLGAAPGNSNGLRLQGSLWESRSQGASSSRCVVVYCPSCEGAELAGFEGAEAFTMASYLLPVHVALFWIKPSASFGRRIGHRAVDVRRVVDQLRRHFGYEIVALWGHNEGAAAALRCAADCNSSIAALVCESVPHGDVMSALELPDWFTSGIYGLKQWVQSVPTVTCGTTPPQSDPLEVITPAYPTLRPALARSPSPRSHRHVKFADDVDASSGTADQGREPDKNDYPPEMQAMEATSLMEVVGRCFMPALFVHGDSDSIVPPAQARKLQRKYGGEGQLLLVEGGGRSSRMPSPTLAKATMLLVRALQRDLDRDATVAEAIQHLTRLAAAKAKPAIETMAPGITENDVRRFLRSDACDANRCHGFLQATLLAFPALRVSSFSQISPMRSASATTTVGRGRESAGRSAPRRDHADENNETTRLHVVATVALPTVESEVVLAWAQTVHRSEHDSFGLVHFVRLCSSMASVTAAKVESGGGIGTLSDSRTSATGVVSVADHLVSIDTLCVEQLRLGVGGHGHQIEIRAGSSGNIDVVVAGYRVACARPDAGGDCAPTFRDDRPLLLWSGLSQRSNLEFALVAGCSGCNGVSAFPASEQALNQSSCVLDCDATGTLLRKGHGEHAEYIANPSTGHVLPGQQPASPRSATVSPRRRPSPISVGATLLSCSTLVTKAGSTLVFTESESEFESHQDISPRTLPRSTSPNQPWMSVSPRCANQLPKFGAQDTFGNDDVLAESMRTLYCPRRGIQDEPQEACPTTAPCRSPATTFDKDAGLSMLPRFEPPAWAAARNTWPSERQAAMRSVGRRHSWAGEGLH